MSSSRQCVATFLILATSCSVTSARAASLGGMIEKIGNGLITSSYPSVAFFITGSGGFCTATLIGCQTALTAAHCVCPEGASGVSCGTPNAANNFLFFQNSSIYAVSSIVVNPNWVPITVGLARHDLAPVPARGESAARG